MLPSANARHSPALAWLFLVGLLPSIARLRFTRQIHHNRNLLAGYRPNPIPGSPTKPAKAITGSETTKNLKHATKHLKTAESKAITNT